LVTGYTAWAPAFVIKIWSGPTIQPTSPAGITNITVVNNRVSYTASPLFNDGSDYPAHMTDMSAWIPAAGGIAIINVDAELHAPTSTQIIAGQVCSIGAIGLQNFCNISLYPAGGWYAQDVHVEHPLGAAQQITLTFSVSSGSPDNSAMDIFLEGYTLPN
jgi:hypothetical protein